MATGSNEDIFDYCLLPAQYNSLVRNTRYAVSEGERSLLQAVLEDAIRSYLSHRNASTRLRRLRFLEARGWFEERADCGARGLFAYETLCEVLGIDPDLLRERLGVKKDTRQSQGQLAARMKITRTKRGPL
jgi:hypothetical protein